MPWDIIAKKLGRTKEDCIEKMKNLKKDTDFKFEKPKVKNSRRKVTSELVDYIRNNLKVECPSLNSKRR